MQERPARTGTHERVPRQPITVLRAHAQESSKCKDLQGNQASAWQTPCTDAVSQLYQRRHGVSCGNVLAVAASNRGQGCCADTYATRMTALCLCADAALTSGAGRTTLACAALTPMMYGAVPAA